MLFYSQVIVQFFRFAFQLIKLGKIVYMEIVTWHGVTWNELFPSTHCYRMAMSEGDALLCAEENIKPVNQPARNRSNMPSPDEEMELDRSPNSWSNENHYNSIRACDK